MINATTGKPYQGQNADLCIRAMAAFDFNSDKFATFKQWKDAGRMVSKGQKGLRLVKFVDKSETRTDGKTYKRTVPVPFTVFNFEQTKPLS